MTEERLGSMYLFRGQTVVLLEAGKLGLMVYYRVVQITEDGFEIPVDDEILQVDRMDFLSEAEPVFKTPPTRSEIDSALSMMEEHIPDVPEVVPEQKKRRAPRAAQPAEQPDGPRVLFSKQLVHGVASRFWVRAAAAAGHSNEDIAEAFRRIGIRPGMDTLRQNAKIGRDSGAILPEWGITAEQVSEFVAAVPA